MKINCKTNTKTNPILLHKYVFSVLGNLEEDTEKQAYVEVKSLTAKSLQKCLLGDGKSFDYVEMFNSQVKSVHGVFNDFTQTYMTKEEMVESKVNITIWTLIVDVCQHLISEMVITEEETKN